MAIELSRGVWLAGKRGRGCIFCGHGTFHDKCIRCEIRQQNIEQKKLRLRNRALKSGIVRLKEEVPT